MGDMNEKCCKCKKTVLPDKKYCASHNKYNILEEKLKQFKQKNDKWGIQFCEAAMQDNSFNPLKPKQSLWPKNDYSSRVATLSEWTEIIFNEYEAVFNALLQATVHTKGKKLEDQNLRATKLAKGLKSNHKKVRLMDGHGRFLLKFFLEVIRLWGKDRLNQLIVEIVDIDKIVTIYHSSLFYGPGCSNVRCITGDITEFKQDIDTLVYFNFCGISKSFEKVQEYLDKLPHECSFMISYSVSRAAKKKNYGQSLNQRISKKEMYLELVKSDREDFKTCWLTYHKSIAKEKNDKEPKGRVENNKKEKNEKKDKDKEKKQNLCVSTQGKRYHPGHIYKWGNRYGNGEKYSCCKQKVGAPGCH